MYLTPPFIGQILANIPFSKRPGIGGTYKKRLKEINDVEGYTAVERKAYILNKMKLIVEHAYNTVPFYEHFYNENNFHPLDLKEFEDIKKIPITRKSDLLKWDIEKRSFTAKGRYAVNTGGTSGQPLAFYITPDSMGHEWAHIHSIWKQLDYHSSDLRLVFGGRSVLGKKIEYDATRHQFNIDIYSDYSKIRNELLALFSKNEIRFLHGYPSAIYEFALFVKTDVELLNLLRESIHGIFLGSEFPHNYFRETIETTFEAKTVSWYGHTERAILAYEKEESFLYFPFHSYGHTEVVLNNEEEYEVIGTSYNNFASPFIRYSTEDTIDAPTFNEGVLESFLIVKGRSGEFVFDKNGKKIALTGLIFGRHHELFDYSNQIQVYQKESGYITILYSSTEVNETEAKAMFDTNNVELIFDFKRIGNPIKTPSGKIKLLVDKI
jgi:phenylacetate-CoA ligase